MSHTSFLYEDSHYHVDASARRYYATHNGDYSGKITLTGYTRKQEEGSQPPDFKVEVPFAALANLVAEYARSRAIEELEQATTSQLLLGKWLS